MNKFIFYVRLLVPTACFAFYCFCMCRAAVVLLVMEKRATSMSGIGYIALGLVAVWAGIKFYEIFETQDILKERRKNN